MASDEKEQPTEALEQIKPDLYQLLVRRAARDRQWAEYFLLVSTCFEIIKQVPTTSEACDQANIEELLMEVLESLGEAIAEVLPGGADEFRDYMPRS